MSANRIRILWWRLCCTLVILLSALAFTPFVLSTGNYLPELFGIPRTLWLGMLIAFALVALTLVGGFLHPANFADRKDDQGRDRG